MATRKPSKLYVGAERYELVVLKVEGRNELGQPRECRIVLDDDVVQIAGGEEFITAFVPARVLRRPN